MILRVSIDITIKLKFITNLHILPRVGNSKTFQLRHETFAQKMIINNQYIHKQLEMESKLRSEIR